MKNFIQYNVNINSNIYFIANDDNNETYYKQFLFLKESTFGNDHIFLVFM